MIEGSNDCPTQTLNHGLPLVYSWSTGQECLPRRAVQLPRHPRPFQLLGLEAPPWHHSGPLDKPFDFSGQIERLSADIVRRCQELRHIDANRLIFGMTQARTSRKHGLQARVTPLRFRKGKLTRRRHGYDYQIQRYRVDDREVLYLVTFCLPRFLDQDFEEKFVTLFHELYHINPDFDGDLRRHPGRCSMHSRSKNNYDRHMAQLAREYLANGADPALHGFMRLNFSQLRHRHGSVTGVVVPRPRLLPLNDHKDYAKQATNPVEPHL